jgi:hypothetical protein
MLRRTGKLLPSDQLLQSIDNQKISISVTPVTFSIGNYIDYFEFIVIFRDSLLTFPGLHLQPFRAWVALL